MRRTIENLLYATSNPNIYRPAGNSRLVAFRVYVSLIKAFTLALGFIASPQIAVAESRLIMITSDHCFFCQAWEFDVGSVYYKSPYAATLPLDRVEIGSKMPRGVTLQKPIVGTPTFLIIHNDQEVDRQSGYIDADMFWWWLSEHTAK